MNRRFLALGTATVMLLFCLSNDTQNSHEVQTVYNPSDVFTTSTVATTQKSATDTIIQITAKSTNSITTTEKSRQTTTTASKSIADKVNNLCKKHHVIGLSLAVFRGEDTLYTQSYGYSNKEEKIKANQDTKYRIASISKAITGMMTMDLAEKGKIDIREDISKYINLKIRSPYYPDIPITTWNLLTHTSGITDFSPYFVKATDVSPFVTLKTIIDNGSCFHKGKPGSRFSYSNFGAGLLAGVIEGATGQRFYDYAELSLMEPMGIDAGYIRTKIKDKQNLASMYSGSYRTVNLKKWNRVDSAYSHMPIGQMYLLAHGDLIISAVDLAKLAMLLCGDGSYKGKQIIEKSAIKLINTPQVKDNGNDAGLTLAMSKSLVKGRKLHGHSGQAYGMVAGMYYDPKDKTGIVFITNGCDRSKNSTGNYAISYDILNLAYSGIL
ncbi:MAG: serine hydrolase [Oscillospiraceae bacterium]|nr:serine hydrolase [Oscillospiraceae bacterium]